MTKSIMLCISLKLSIKFTKVILSIRLIFIGDCSMKILMIYILKTDTDTDTDTVAETEKKKN